MSDLKYRGFVDAPDTKPVAGMIVYLWLNDIFHAKFVIERHCEKRNISIIFVDHELELKCLTRNEYSYFKKGTLYTGTPKNLYLYRMPKVIEQLHMFPEVVCQ